MQVRFGLCFKTCFCFKLNYYIIIELLVWSKNKGGPPGPLPWICYCGSLNVFLKNKEKGKKSSRCFSFIHRYNFYYQLLTICQPRDKKLSWSDFAKYYYFVGQWIQQKVKYFIPFPGCRPACSLSTCNCLQRYWPKKRGQRTQRS